MLSIMIYCFKILRDGKFIHSSVDFSTLKCSSENPPMFSGEACTVLRRSVHCSPEKRALFFGHLFKGIFVAKKGFFCIQQTHKNHVRILGFSTSPRIFERFAFFAIRGVGIKQNCPQINFRKLSTKFNSTGYCLYIQLLHAN